MIQFIEEPTQPWFVEDMPAEEYHAYPAIGSSMIEDFRNEGRRGYFAMHVEKTKTKESTDEMDLGTLIHIMLFEPEKYHDKVATPLPEVAPDGKKWYRRKGSDHERWWQEELDARAGKVIIKKPENIKHAQKAVEAIRNSEVAQQFLSRQGKVEYSIFWIDKETKLPMKCRVDWMSSVALDLKTTSDPTPYAYAMQMKRMGYHRKKAHYEAGLLALFGKNAPPFAHLCVETQDPYRVASYDLDDADKNGHSLGRGQRRHTLTQLAHCYASGNWSEVWERDPKRLALPSSAFYEDEYTYSEALA